VKALLLLLALAGPSDKATSTLITSARKQVGVTVGYDNKWTKVSYPGGDVDEKTGTCADVVIRSFRALGVDLQEKIHEDMVANFDAYPRKWGLRTTDRSIDHRRVPNLMTYFHRRGKDAAISSKSADYKPGDIVAWDLGGGVTHIGIVSDKKAILSERWLVIHNIGGGVKEEDMLFHFKIIGHYRYFA
jgi:uncharacterized protein YijF (DUF1287 family)